MADRVAGGTAVRDELDNQLAAEEHLQGKPIGERGHCSHCDKAAEEIERGIARAQRLRLQSECAHDSEEKIVLDTMCGRHDELHYCTSCGLELRHEWWTA